MKLPILGGRTVTRQRFGAPVWVGGRPVRPEPATLDGTMSVQPVPETSVQWLDSGYSLSDFIHLIGYMDFRTGDESLTDVGAYADRVLVDDVLYEVRSVKKLPDFFVEGHWQVDALRVQAVAPVDGVLPEEDP